MSGIEELESSSDKAPQAISSKLFEIAERNSEQNQSAVYNQAGVEFAQGNLHKGQQLLEQPGSWNDELRLVATQANQQESQRTGTNPLSFQESQAILNRSAEELGSVGDQGDRRDALEIQGIVLQMNKPGQEGMQGIEKTLKYVEGLLQTRATSQRKLTPEIKQSLV
mgnify:FL=1